jgi:hypothetical protein
MALQYPKKLPTPTRRKGALVYEMRVRVPQEARGARFKATHTTRSLVTRDKAEALRKIPRAYEQLHADFEAEATSLGGVMPTASKLTVSDVCRIQRQRLLESEEILIGSKRSVSQLSVSSSVPASLVLWLGTRSVFPN